MFGIGILTPSTVEAQICETCDNATGICDPNAADPDDRCYQGIDWEEGRLYCVSWGSIMDCDPWLSDVGADGALPGAARFASVASASGEFTALGPESKYVRDCRTRIVARWYTSDEAADMRRRTETLEI